MHCLAAIPGVELKVLVPHRWRNYGKWREPVISPDLEKYMQVERVRWPWTGPGQWYLHWYPSMAKLLREFQPDIIDLWEEPWGLVSAQAVFLRNRIVPKAKIVSETEQNINKRLPPPFEQIRKYVLRHADYAVGRNQAAISVLRAKGYTGPAETVPNAVDTELFRPMDRTACRAEARFGGFVVGYVGRLVPQKGLIDLVEAVAQCPADVSVVMIGSGPLEAELRACAQRLNIGARLLLVPAKPLEQLPSLMNAMDVLVLPSRTTARWKEQFGRVLIEAQACGIPVIGANSGAIPDVVGTCGRIFPEGDIGALAREMMLLHDDESLRQTLGNAGIVNANEHYTWMKVAQRMHAIYLRVLKS